MDFTTNTKKRALSVTELPRSPEQKRARILPRNPSKPALRVDCTVPQRPLPQPIQNLSPPSFSVDSSATFTSSVHSVHSAARFYQHQSSNQMYDCQQPYNYQPKSYQPPLYRSTEAPYWKGFPGYQPAWTTPRMPHGTGYNFADMCQTSVSSSVYSGFSDNSGQVGDFASAIRTSVPMVLPNKSVDARDTFISALVSRIVEMKDTLVAQQRSIEEILQMAPLLDNYH